MCRDPVVVYRAGTTEPGTGDMSWALEDVHKISHWREGTANFNDSGAACRRRCAKRLQHRTGDSEPLSALG
ncbi:hypothetical protein AV530_011120 [Patagioenas fasciata monilis]|uniref:Uncharacterized protein n=1 Tax=Patagioenas fasciata monilis TaxID=372326 RepID=A0A1V4JW21_PATFA|nr:hypothetical protein AV530_011120 [Patagioenas fasciata monilis]